MRQKFSKLFLRMRIYLAQDIFEVFKRIDFICFAGGDKAVDDQRICQ